MHQPTDATYLRKHAERCRRLAAAINDASVAATLRSMAKEHDTRAAQSEPRPNPTDSAPTLTLMLNPSQ